MALIKCPECGKDISNTIENCIHCGYKLKKESSPSAVISDNDSIPKIQSENQESISEESRNGCLKFILCVCGVIVLFVLFAFCISSFSKCAFCTDGFNSCENCTNGKVTCDLCEGKTIVECDNCNDNYKAKCATCNGTGDGDSYSFKCHICGGNGKIQFDCDNCLGGFTYSTTQGYVKCMICNGSGKASPTKCIHCGGDGISSGYENCKICDGSGFGKDDCTKCNKTKEIKCEKCSATGFISCSDCDGTMKIACEKCNNGHTNTATAK